MGESIARLYNNEMKKLLTTMFVALLMAGCGSEEDIAIPKMIRKRPSGLECQPSRGITRLSTILGLCTPLEREYPKITRKPMLG